jgi:membrane-bound lytic murein transglycosylase F
MRHYVAALALLPIAATQPVDVSMMVDSPRVAYFSESPELVVLTRNGPTTRYVDADGNFAGIENDLVELFARDLGVPVRYVEAESHSDILPALEQHRAHMAAAALVVTAERNTRFLFGPPYMQVRQVVVYNRADAARPRTLRDLVSKRIEVAARSSSAEHLRRLAERLPSLSWEEVPAADPEDLLVRVAEGSTPYAVVASHVADAGRNFYPNLGKSLSVGAFEHVAWAFPLDGDPMLVRRARDFFKRIQADGTMKRLADRYYGHVDRIASADLRHVYETMRTRLPEYRPFFQEAQVLTGIDWRLLAALAFQESRWDPLATSPTGVRGMMMLTTSTADRLGVKDRLDPRESILAGARYLRDLRDSLPARIREPDRTWMALAAYNQGVGHFEDARVLAQRMGLSPDVWIDVKRALPLLSVEEHYETLKYGFARGGEAVALAENVRTYYEILQRFEQPHQPGAPGIDRLLTTFQQQRPASRIAVALD